MAKLVLKNGSICLVDESDLTELSKYRWIERKDFASGTVYAAAYINGKYVLMHRLLLCIVGLRFIGDHINGDGLDNRRCNLRIVDHTGNMRNRKRNKNNSTGKTGIHYRGDHGSAGAYTAYAMINNKLVSKTFGCLRVGKEQAFSLACSWRNSIENLNNITVRGNLL